MARKTIQEVLNEHTASLMALPGVVGTALGGQAGKPSILVFVTKKTAVTPNAIPLALDGYPVAVVETGEIAASATE